MNIVKVNGLEDIKADHYLTGTVLKLPNGQLWRVYRNGFKRITKIDGTLLKGAAKYMPKERES